MIMKRLFLLCTLFGASSTLLSMDSGTNSSMDSAKELSAADIEEFFDKKQLTIVAAMRYNDGIKKKDVIETNKIRTSFCKAYAATMMEHAALHKGKVLEFNLLESCCAALWLLKEFHHDFGNKIEAKKAADLIHELCSQADNKQLLEKKVTEAESTSDLLVLYAGSRALSILYICGIYDHALYVEKAPTLKMRGAQLENVQQQKDEDQKKKAPELFQRFEQGMLTIEEAKQFLSPGNELACKAFYDNYGWKVTDSKRYKKLTEKSDGYGPRAKHLLSDIENTCAAIWLYEQLGLRKSGKYSEFNNESGQLIVLSNKTTLEEAVGNAEGAHDKKTIKQGLQALSILELYAGYRNQIVGKQEHDQEMAAYVAEKRQLLLQKLAAIEASEKAALEKEVDAIFQHFTQGTLTFEEVKQWFNNPAHTHICEAFFAKHLNNILESELIKSTLSKKDNGAAPIPVATTEGFFSDIENCCAALWLLEQEAIREGKTSDIYEKIAFKGHSIINRERANLKQALSDAEHMDVAAAKEDELPIKRIMINNCFQALTIFQMFTGCLNSTSDSRALLRKLKNEDDAEKRPVFERKLKEIEAREKEIRGRKAHTAAQAAKSTPAKQQKKRGFLSSLQSPISLKKLFIGAGALATIGVASWFAYKQYGNKNKTGQKPQPQRG
jgi:hypothetical protein